jgi:hypothetical protein
MFIRRLRKLTQYYNVAYVVTLYTYTLTDKPQLPLDSTDPAFAQAYHKLDSLKALLHSIQHQAAQEVEKKEYDQQKTEYQKRLHERFGFGVDYEEATEKK